jgi:hypothetical protein
MRACEASLVVTCCVLLLGCSSPPALLPNDAPTLTVCTAARRPVGSRVRVRGELLDAGVPSGPVLTSDELCSERGGGTIFATLYDPSEWRKIGNAQPRGTRSRRGIPGALLTFDGTITKIEDGRFVHLDQVVVR